MGKKQKRRDISLVRDLQAQGKTPYSKMVTKLVIFFCLFGNWPSMPLKLFFTSADVIKAKRADKPNYKREVMLLPF